MKTKIINKYFFFFVILLLVSSPLKSEETKKISDNMSSELGSMSSGMGLPPGMKLPF